MRILLLMMAALFACPIVPSAHAAGTDSISTASASDPDYDKGKQAILANNWKLAIEQFGRAVVRDPGNADIHNYLGFAYRKSGNLDAAFKSYAEALRLEPGHKGAHEYVGEAYLLINHLARAEEHLAALDKICFFPCEEFRDLKKQIEEYKAKRANR